MTLGVDSVMPRVVVGRAPNQATNRRLDQIGQASTMSFRHPSLYQGVNQLKNVDSCRKAVENPRLSTELNVEKDYPNETTPSRAGDFDKRPAHVPRGAALGHLGSVVHACVLPGIHAGRHSESTHDGISDISPPS